MMPEKQSYSERPWKHLLEKMNLPLTLEPYPDIPLYNFLDQAASEFPKKTACVYLDNNITYSRILDETNRFANALHQLGVKKGDRVATILPNSPQFIIADYGIMKAGAANVPCSPLHSAHDLEYELGEAGVETIIYIDTSHELVDEVKKKTELKNIIITNPHDYSREDVLPPSIPHAYLFRELIEDSDPVPPRVEINPKEDLAEVPFTGGATGLPKGVMLTHHNMACNVLQMWGLLNSQELISYVLRGNAAVLLALPFFHQYGHWAMHTAVYNAWKMLLVPNPRDTDMMIRLMQKHRPFMNIGVPTQYMRLATGKVKQVGVIGASGSAALPPEVAEEYEKKTGAPVDEGYGLTECSPVTHANLSGLRRLIPEREEPIEIPPWGISLIKFIVRVVGGERIMRGITRLVPALTKAAQKREAKEGTATRKKGSIGAPIIDTDVKIVDAEGKEVPFGETGEMWIRGPQVMKGYWPTPGQGLIDGWLPTGDIARMDEDGYFYVVDRIKDMINISGYKVYSRVVDDVLYQHPAVQMAGAIGIPDPERKGSERIKAFIRLKPGFEGKVTEDDMIRHCRDNLPPYAVPRFVEFRDDLPLTTTEKIFKRKLREEEIDKMKQQGLI
jgi:long-chain acyl-CoA synthetase